MWSLGVVFWEMLTLEVPFADMPPAQLIGGEPAACWEDRPQGLQAWRRAHARSARRIAAVPWRASLPPTCAARDARRPCPCCCLRLAPVAGTAADPPPGGAANPPAALGLGKLRLAIPAWCEPDWRALMESCWVEDPALRPSCRWGARAGRLAGWLVCGVAGWFAGRLAAWGWGWGCWQALWRWPASMASLGSL